MLKKKDKKKTRNNASKRCSREYRMNKTSIVYAYSEIQKFRNNSEIKKFRILM